MTILVVDDEPGLAAGLAEELEAQGLGECLVATSAEEAVEIVNKRKTLDVLITNALMQPADGFTLQQTLAQHLPNLKSVFLSDRDLSERAAEVGAIPVLVKPIDPTNVAEVVRELTNPTPASPVVKGPPPIKVASSWVPGTFMVEEGMWPDDDWVGHSIGGCHIEAKLGESEYGGIYKALQTAMGRYVRLYALRPEKAQDPAVVQQFIANASIKAKVSHPAIFAVYEAGERDGIHYYTCEYNPCESLAHLAATGRKVDTVAMLQILAGIADVMTYFVRDGIHYEPLTAETFLLDTKKRLRVANIAAFDREATPDLAGEMRAIAEALSPLVTEGPDAGVIRHLLFKMAGNESGEIRSWPGLAQIARAELPRLAPKDAHKLDAREQAAIKAVEDARQRRKRAMLLSAAGATALFVAVAVAFWWLFLKPPAARVFDRMVEIPSGEFIFGDGQKKTLPAFWIDEFEVTIADYGRFLEWAAINPEELSKVEHPGQPKGKSHVPAGWADQDSPSGRIPGYYSRARNGQEYEGVKLDPTAPVFGLDWFDAYAYAKWRDRRLPTEEEWEKAARGTTGLIYPWGDEPDEKKANTAGAGEGRDDFARWSPVDAIRTDRSPFGVKGMAGNVSEWTATWAESEVAGGKAPVIKGGNYSGDDYRLTRRVTSQLPSQNHPALGFRTVSDAPPQQP
jgi:formylglycine-generating enzyme required for sulfatase activity/CheY-like chemotaxis protein